MSEDGEMMDTASENEDFGEARLGMIDDEVGKIMSFESLFCFYLYLISVL